MHEKNYLYLSGVVCSKLQYVIIKLESMKTLERHIIDTPQTVRTLTYNTGKTRLDLMNSQSYVIILLHGKYLEK